VEIYGSCDIAPQGSTFAQNVDTSILIDGGLLTSAGGNPYQGKINMNIINGGVVDTTDGELSLSYSGQNGCLDLLNIDDGSLTTAGIKNPNPLYLLLGIDIVIGANGVMVVGGGLAERAEVEQLYADGLLYAGVPGEGLAITYDYGTETTTIQIPEPATIALLGFGGLLLRRRR
jgi:hypothetical protein